jgi:hypothetical protein
MIVRVLIILALALCVPFAAQGGDYDGSKTLLCTPTNSVSCDGAGECKRGTTEELEVPPFIKIDFGKKLLSGKLKRGDERQTPIGNVKADEGSTLLQGGEYGRGWSFVIQHDTGEMSAAIAGDEGAIILLGACTVD